MSYGALDTTHHSLHDFAVLRAISKITIVAPADNFETREARGFAVDTSMGRIAEPLVTVGPAIFLSSLAASFCTGVDLLVDGGLVCW